MPKFIYKKWHGQHMLWTFMLLLAVVVVLFFYQWLIGVLALILCGVLAFFTIQSEQAFRNDLNQYVNTITYRVKKVGNEVFNELPIGIVLYNEENIVEWHNAYVAKMLERDSIVSDRIVEWFPQLRNQKDKDQTVEVTVGKRVYQARVKADERLLYFQDITTMSVLSRKYEEEKMAFGIVMLDNLDEASQGMDDQTRSVMLAKVTGEITEWAQKFELLIRRLSADKFLIVTNMKNLKALEQNRFEILDHIRDLTIEQKLPLTLSIGISAGSDSLIELGHLVQTSLDIALGRGGDQVAVKVGQRLSFYGGKSNAVEKRTRVRARVISHAMRELIRDSSKVLIMGHLMPDMDSIGAAIGVLKMARISGKEGYIVLEGLNPSIQKLMETLYEDERLSQSFILPEQAMHLITENTLVVVVDTHKASLLSEPKLVQQNTRIMVIDHHRRGEEFINEAVLVYMEPYASSTCELVTELLQYFQERLQMDVLEATSLLAGIIMDTRSFTLRTGARTFEAASFLRRNGADSSLVQNIMREDLQEYMAKAEIIRTAVIEYNRIAIAVTEPHRKYSQLLISQVADTLLNMTDIAASFVISERADGIIGISARSSGDINVQVVMEKLGGGGHLTNAATQLEGTIREAKQKLDAVLAEINQEEELFQ